MRRHPPGFRVRALTLVPAFALLILASPAGAQYMYLDSNGDGIHTAADVVHEIGPTVVDIWFDIAHNRDGSATSCSVSPGTPLDMFSYGVVLECVDGTLSFSTFTNRIVEMGPIGLTHAPDSRYFTGSYFTSGSTILPPGKYLLGTLTINVTSGMPSLHIVPQVTWTTPFLYDDYTLFGSHCDATTYPNSPALGVDWYDSDGLAFGAGGTPNQGPHLAPISNMTVPSGGNATQAITASDPEGQPLTFSKASGPPFLFVTTLEQGAGMAGGEIRLAPFVSDVGTAIAGVSVTDGAASDQASFGLAVSLGPNHIPYVAPIPKLTVIAGQVRTFYLGAGDPDGGTLHFAKTSGPAYASLRELASRPGGASAAVTLKPTICDIGSATAAFSVTDGVATQQRQVALSIIPGTPRPALATQYFPAGFMHAIRLADLNGDGNLDVVSAHEDRHAISILLGSPSGDLSPQVLYPVTGQNGFIAVGDFDGDGKVDVAVTETEGASLGVYPGRGDGTLLAGRTYPTGTGPHAIEAVDLNRDGVLDLITMNEEPGTVSVLLGAGDGTFGAKHDSPAGLMPTSFAVGDFNLDGRPDVALTNSTAGVLTVLPGLGDGTFGDGIETPVGSRPFSITKGDWNWDGILDLAVVDINLGTVQTYAGRGDGTFASGVTVASAPYPSILYACDAEDMNGDGNTDLVVSDVNVVRLLVLFGDGAGGFASPLSLSGRFAAGLAIGDMNSDGRPDMVGTAEPAVGVYWNVFPVPISVEARAFVQREQPAVRTGSGRELCIRLEPVHGSYVNDVVDVASITLTSEGTGSVSEVHSITPRSAIVADTDRNGVVELGIYFSRSDVDAMFDQNEADNSALAQMTGSLTDGRKFCTSVQLNVDGGQHQNRVFFAPNPLNPQSQLTFSTYREGPARVQLFDIQGRLVRTMLDAARLPAGTHKVAFDGRSANKTQLSSGVLFYRVTSVEGTFEGRIIILK